jgi:hypothetical protein
MFAWPITAVTASGTAEWFRPEFSLHPERCAVHSAAIA